jgi:hypothetical protein
MSEQEKFPFEEEAQGKLDKQCQQVAKNRKLRKNPSGSYKVRLGFDTGPHTCKRFMSFGLKTRHPMVALDKANFLQNCFKKAGYFRGERVSIVSDDEATNQLNKLEEARLQDAYELNRLRGEITQLKATLKKVSRDHEVLKKRIG